jgi:hypothetical protein
LAPDLRPAPGADTPPDPDCAAVSVGRRGEVMSRVGVAGYARPRLGRQRGRHPVSHCASFATSQRLAGFQGALAHQHLAKAEPFAVTQAQFGRHWVRPDHKRASVTVMTPQYEPQSSSRTIRVRSRVRSLRTASLEAQLRHRPSDLRPTDAERAFVRARGRRAAWAVFSDEHQADAAAALERDACE